MLVVSGCATGASRIDEAAEIDATIQTSATRGPEIAPGVLVGDDVKTSDATTIRNAVSSANLATLGSSGLPWANVETGSQGVVTAITETKAHRAPCRQFTTTREAFDGVALFRGEACLGENGLWRTSAFEAL